jgi:hypothetical protein
MRIAVLGPLEVVANDSAPVVVPGAPERLLLAVLATGAPGVSPADRLIEALWNGDPPPAAAEALHAHLRLLRGALEPGLPERSSGQYVLRRGAGYALAVARADIDALRFADLAGRGRARLAAGEPADAARLLTTALGLWRGDPYSDWPDAAFAGAERGRLAGIRADAEAALVDARQLLARQVGTPPVPARPVREVHHAPARPLDVPNRDEPLPPLTPAVGTEPAAAVPEDVDADGPDGPDGPEGRADADDDPGAAHRAIGRHGTGLLVGGVAAALVTALVAARLSASSEHQAQEAVSVADANRLVALSASETRLDISLLLAAQAFRLADTPETRGGLTAALDGRGRVERAVSVGGVPLDALLAGGRTVAFGVGDSLVVWAVGPSTLPSELLEIPAEWGAVTVVAPSAVEDLLLLAGVYRTGTPWLRTTSTLDGTSRLLLEGDQVGGRPVDGAVTADGRSLLLLVAEPEGAARGATRWHVIEVGVADGIRRDTGIGGVAPVPFEWLRADFADDSASVVLWDGTGDADATLVQVADGRQTPIAVRPRPAESFGFRALPAGVAQLWDDGAITLVDRAGTTTQELDFLQEPVRDIAFSPDGTWAVTAGFGGDVFRWDVDLATGRWSGRERLSGHAGDVLGVEVEPGGRRIITVSADHTVIAWDMTADLETTNRAFADAAVRLETVCAIVARDFTPVEWRRFLPDRPWQPTCTDLP